MKKPYHPTAEARALEFKKEQLEALTALDPQKMMDLFDKWSEPPVRARLRAQWRAHGDIFMHVVMHKTRAALDGLPKEMRLDSMAWLEKHHYSIRTAEELAEIARNKLKSL
jgi:hypothetical protein